MSWKTWTVIGLIVLAVYAIYAFASVQNAQAPEPVRPTATAQTSPRFTAPAPGVGVIHTEWLETQSGRYRSERNLFAYKEPPPTPPPKIIVQPPPPPPPPMPVQPVEPPKPQPPPFTYHYIGTFGTSANPIATFSNNGEIVNVRVGETIDGKFILRGIGIESAEIGFVGFPPDVKTRIALGQ